MNPQAPKLQHLELTPNRNNTPKTRTFLDIPHGRMGSSLVNAYHHSQTPHMMEEIYEQQMEVQEQGIIYGTNVSTAKVTEQLMRFIQQFQAIGQDQIPIKIYKQKLQSLDLDLLDYRLFQIEGSHIKQYDPQIYYQLIYYPAQIITLLDQVVKKLYQEHYIDNQQNQSKRKVKNQKRDTVMVSIKKLNEVTLMRDLEEKHINRLICFRGIVIRCSQIYPQMKAAMFRCINRHCRAEILIQLENAKVSEPKKCPICKISDSFQLVHNYSHFTDKQFIKFQQLPQYVPQGHTPTSMNLVCYDNNANRMRPGDRVQIVGILRCQARKINRMRSTTRSVFKTFTDMISFRVLQQNRFKASLAENQTIFKEQQKQQFFNIASSKSIIDDLVQSFASSIYGHQNIKKGLLAQIFGGTQKKFQGRGRFRSDINICLVGDPSTAKSQLLKQVYHIAPRGIYTSGKSSSAVGLTANVKKDPQTRQFILQSGALVLSDLGICCIDQFDKMQQNSKLILLQAMEQQTISVAKAGIVCQLNTRTSILSAANPILSKYDPRRSVVENINLPPALLTRFDLIYIILDIPNKTIDTKLAKHVLELFSGMSLQDKKKAPKISRDKLVKYITYARQYIRPKITDKAAKKLKQCYLQMRRAGSGRGTVSATPRQLQSLIRISQAFAKMKLSSEVQQDDVMTAYDLIKDALKQSATDPSTGMIDMDVIVTGQTSASKKRVDMIINIFKQLFQANVSDYLNKKILFDKAKAEVQKKWYVTQQTQRMPKEQQIKKALQRLQKDGYVNLFGYDRNRPQFKFLNPDNIGSI